MYEHNPFGSKHRLARFGVNMLTGSGGALAAVSIIFSFQNMPVYALGLLILAVLIDAIDGTVIRMFALEDILPEFDGERLDEYADLITFVIAPISFAWGIGVLPFTIGGLLTGMIVCTVSIVQFSHQAAKTGAAFWGFPSYWNIVFFYGWALSIPDDWMIFICLVLCLSVFVPIPFIYPSKFPKFRGVTITLGAVWWFMLFGYLIWPDPPSYFIHASFFYPVYYLILSVFYYPELSREIEQSES